MLLRFDTREVFTTYVIVFMSND